MNAFTLQISKELNLPVHSVENTLQLLDDGCTIPFISRYRKERTGSLDEVAVGQIQERYHWHKEFQKRKESILKSIETQGKLTPKLKLQIDNCQDSNELEDYYLPYKAKRHTKAQIAREQGLEPLATLIFLQREPDPEKNASTFVKGDIANADSAVKGALNIIAETISEDEQARRDIRNIYKHEAMISSKVITKVKHEEKAQKYADYFNFSEPLRRCSSFRLLAMRRGETEGILKVSISADEEKCLRQLNHRFVNSQGTCGKLVRQAIEDGYKRLLKPSIETEFSNSSKDQACKEAIDVFADNLRQLLLAPPLGPKRVMGVDPGFRTGCKVVCLDAQGNLLHEEVIKPHPPVNDCSGAAKQVERMVKDYQIEAISIGNGTASRETSSFIHGLTFDHPVQVFVVSEDGASVYSASETAREEFPKEDITVRGAVSIGRRLMDPLAELVKIDPKSIGVGQYQHDVDQGKLKERLDQTVVSCVNSIGVNLNTASKYLLSYVSGLGPVLSQNIIDYRKKNGAFTSRVQLLKVPRLGPNAYRQCAAFLRIPNSPNPLDNSAVHPESYPVVEKMAKDCDCKITDLIGHPDQLRKIHLTDYVTDTIGMPTLTDILKELEKPGRDPRNQVEVFEFDPNVKTLEDLQPGMVLPGIVTNITQFGAFVDIGVHQDGLVHISQLSDHFVKSPGEVVKLHQHVKVRVLDIDQVRHRIALSMKGIVKG
ncbi:RNA-binding transcriptional accessory protein [Prevotella cerevisiae]|uniref:RNA-binding transcriptional accessory protein n=1 Tax=Segatella cerevisiae TaxID=2053716 RepID=A0ABT1BUK8_9BACT|nr:Tex family protein [Segatella cerevisiae]MCO6024773.1 RNA-binding transcriptional accessory protein [Segatella cerevisiae]